MDLKKVLTTLAVVAVVLIAGCNKEELFRNAPDLSNANLARNQFLAFNSPVPLGTASTFAVLGGTTVTNADSSVLTGDLGVSPGTAITGFEPAPINTIMGPGTVTPGAGVVIGTIYAGGPVAAQAHNDATIAYQYLVAQEPDTLPYLGVTQLAGRTFTPGVYNFASSANLMVGGTLTLDFQGNSDALFIFQVGSTLVTMTNSNVIALNPGTSDCLGSNVFWAVGSSATIDGNSFIGTVIAYTTITMTNTGNVSGATNVSGRMLALGGEVTMVNSIISTCGLSGGGTKPPKPPKPCRNFVTGGGWIDGTANVTGHKHDKDDKATFGVSGGIINGKFWGQLSYTDHGKNAVKVKSKEVTAYLVIDAVTRQIEGIAEVNGHELVTYTVVVVDNGEPGHKWGGNKDSFSLELSNGYKNSGTLEGGNIQLHMKCGDSHNGHDQGDKEDYYDKDEQDGHQNCNRDNNWNRDHNWRR